MSFPETRLTLIHRIASEGSEDDWRQFLNDYWGPVCRFAARRADLNHADAEDVASQTFLALVGGKLLARWHDNRAAKLRTLLCGVVRNVISNRARVEDGRRRLREDHARRHTLDGPLPAQASAEVSREQEDAFYAAWAEDLLVESVETLVEELHAEGKGDAVRVLYGKLCEDLGIPEIAAALGITLSAAENCFKTARRRLSKEVEDRVRRHVARYCRTEDADDEFTGEWQRLGEYLQQHGDLEQAVRDTYATWTDALPHEGHSGVFRATLTRIRRENA